MSSRDCIRASGERRVIGALFEYEGSRAFCFHEATHARRYLSMCQYTSGTSRTYPQRPSFCVQTPGKGSSSTQATPARGAANMFPFLADQVNHAMPILTSIGVARRPFGEELE